MLPWKRLGHGFSTLRLISQRNYLLHSLSADLCVFVCVVLSLPNSTKLIVCTFLVISIIGHYLQGAAGMFSHVQAALGSLRP